MRLSHSYSAIKLFEQCPERYRRQRITKEFKDQGGEASDYGQRLHKMMEDRLKQLGDLPQEAAKYESLCKSVEKLASAPGAQLLVEHEMVFTESLEPTGWWEPDAWLRNKADVLVIDSSVAVLIDWKTGKRNPDPFQMELYAAAVFKLYPEVQRVVTSFVWLKSLETDKDEFVRSQQNSLWATVMGKIRRIYDAYENNVWPARPSGLCGYCPARHDCKFAK